MDTKENIIHTALKLFNTHGMAKITLRSIAKEMGISQGNLNYHFKTRETIVETLYFKMVERIDNTISNNTEPSIELERILHISKSIMFVFYEYRFFMLDFALIMREYSNIRNHYIQLMKQRELEFSGAINTLIEKDIMRDEMFTCEYENLYKRFQILSDFWMSSVVIEKKEITTSSVKQYSKIINQSLYPYLTLKGQEIYKSLSLV